MYSEKVMDHFQHPRNVGEIEDASGVGTVGNPKCGDIMRIYLDIDENQIIRDVKFKTFGCGAAVATSSMATEMVMGKTIEEAMEVTNKAVMEAWTDFPPVKVHCSLLAEEAIHAALWDYAEKSMISRLKDSRNRSLIFTKVKSGRGRILSRRTLYGEEKSSSRHVRGSGFIGGCLAARSSRDMRSSASPCRSGRTKRKRSWKKMVAAVASVPWMMPEEWHPVWRFLTMS